MRNLLDGEMYDSCSKSHAGRNTYLMRIANTQELYRPK